jgi:small-conductance mechanosensitive channel
MRAVEGVLANRPVDVLYHEMGDSAVIFRVRWWIEIYADKRRVIDRVNSALQEAIDEAGIESPFPIHTTNIQIDPRTTGQLGGTSSEMEPEEPTE